MFVVALVVTGLVTNVFLSPPGLVARISSPEFRHSRYTPLLGISADGKRLYTSDPGSFNGQAVLSIWNTATGRELVRHPLGRDLAAIHAIGLGPEGVRVVERENRVGQYRLRIVNPDTGATVRLGKGWKEPPQRVLSGGGFGFGWYNFSPDAAWMIHPTEKGYGFVDTATGAETVIDLGLQSAPFGGNYLFSPDGRLFCAPVDNKGLRLYELPSGKHLGDIANPGDEQQPAAVTPDGKHLLLWTHHKEVWALDSWDIAAQKRRSILSGRSLPGRLHFAPDGTRFALVPGSIGSYRPAGDWEIRDFATGQELGRVPTTDYASRVLFSPDGRTLYTQPGYMVVPWDIPTGKPAAAAPAILGPIDRFRFTPDGKVVGLAGGFVYTWDPLTAKELSRACVPRPIDWYGAVSFNPTADRLHFTAVGDTLDVWDFHRGDVHESPLDLQRFPNSAVEHWFTPDGARHIEHRYGDALLFLRDPATGKETGRVGIPMEWREPRRDGGVYGLALSPDGRRIAIGGNLPYNPGDQRPRPAFVAILNVNGSGKAVLCETQAPVYAVAFSPDGRFVVAPLRDKNPPELGVWNSQTGRRVAIVEWGGGTGHVNSLRFSPDGRTLAISSDRHEVQLVETVSWQVRGLLRIPGWESIGYFGYDRYRDLVTWSPEGRRLAAAMPDGGLAVWNMRQLGVVQQLASAADVQRAWSAVTGTNAKAAFVAIRSLAEAPDRAIPLLRSKITPVAPLDSARLKTLIATLGSPEFAERERASTELAKLGGFVEPTLRAALRATQSPEVARRLGELLERLALAHPTAEETHAARAVEIVEWSATPEAVKLLEGWAAGADGARLTIEARAALKRHKSR